MRSPPMLTIPVLMDGSAARTFEARTPWLTAWARFRAGASPIDYIRPTGAGADALLLSYAQTERPNRDWWLNILDLYGASDVLVAEARLDREYPRSEEHTSELQSLMRISYAVFCLKKKK